LSSLGKRLDTLGLSIFAGLVTAGLICGAVLSLEQYRLELWHVPVVPLVALLAAALLTTAVGARYLLAPRLRKISLRSWLKRRNGR
jgi:hypothetical protein